MARHEVNYEPSVCCDICNAAYACDFDCPACGEQTRIWGDTSEKETIECEKCKAKFFVESAWPFVLVDVDEKNTP